MIKITVKKFALNSWPGIGCVCWPGIDSLPDPINWGPDPTRPDNLGSDTSLDYPPRIGPESGHRSLPSRAQQEEVTLGDLRRPMIENCVMNYLIFCSKQLCISWQSRYIIVKRLKMANS